MIRLKKLFLIVLIWQTSAVNISKIIYKNIVGTSKSEKAMKFACSDSVPCSNIVLSNVNLEKPDGTVETYCNSAQGFKYGTVHPSADCLSTQDNKNIQPITDQNDIVHTERKNTCKRRIRFSQCLRRKCVQVMVVQPAKSWSWHRS